MKFRVVVNFCTGTFTRQNIAIPYTLSDRSEAGLVSLLGNYEGDLRVIPTLQCLACLLDEPSSQLRTCTYKDELNKSQIIAFMGCLAALLLTLGRRKETRDLIYRQKNNSILYLP
jgi:hypothetical protein